MLALAYLSVLPSARRDGVGTLVSKRISRLDTRLHVPLSTLRAQPYDCPRMTRGRCGSLGLHRTTLSFATPRRFIPAHLLASFGPRLAAQPLRFAIISPPSVFMSLRDTRKA
jgi:hypothetical protein